MQVITFKCAACGVVFSGIPVRVLRFGWIFDCCEPCGKEVIDQQYRDAVEYLLSLSEEEREA